MEKPLIFFKDRYAPLSYSRILNETFYISLPVGWAEGHMTNQIFSHRLFEIFLPRELRRKMTTINYRRQFLLPYIKIKYLIVGTR